MLRASEMDLVTLELHSMVPLRPVLWILVFRDLTMIQARFYNFEITMYKVTVQGRFETSSPTVRQDFVCRMEGYRVLNMCLEVAFRVTYGDWQLSIGFFFLLPVVFTSLVIFIF